MRPYTKAQLKEVILTLPGNQADGKTATVMQLSVSKKTGRVAATILWKGIPPLKRQCADTHDYWLRDLLDIIHPRIDAKYTFVKNHLDANSSYEGCLFETYGEEVDYVWSVWQKEQEMFSACSGSTVWTVLEGDEGERMICNGWHYVNRLGYLISTESASQDDEFYYEEDTDEF